MGTSGSGSGFLRINTRDRQEALENLQILTSAGYLDIGEFDARTKKVMAATTRDELYAVFGDIPTNAFTKAADVAAARKKELAEENPISPAPATDIRDKMAALATPSYKGQTVMKANRVGSVRYRTGLLLIVFLVCTALSAIVPIMTWSYLLMLPAWMLLFPMRKGPARWFAPSRKELQAQQYLKQLNQQQQQPPYPI